MSYAIEWAPIGPALYLKRFPTTALPVPLLDDIILTPMDGLLADRPYVGLSRELGGSE